MFQGSSFSSLRLKKRVALFQKGLAGSGRVHGRSAWPFLSACKCRRNFLPRSGNKIPLAFHPSAGIYSPYAVLCGKKTPQPESFTGKGTVHCHKNRQFGASEGLFRCSIPRRKNIPVDQRRPRYGRVYSASAGE